MKKGVFATMLMVLIVALCGCGQPNNTAITNGEWQLETISTEKGIKCVGKAYSSYNDFDGEKIDATLIFSDKQALGCKELSSLAGSYQIDKSKSAENATAIMMYVEDDTEILAVMGIRTRHNDSEVNSLLFEYNDETYSFIQQSN